MADNFSVDVYTDSNGVGWKIITTKDSKQMFATMDQGGSKVYDPEPTDVGPILISGQHGKNDEERQAYTFVLLTDRIKEDIKGRTPKQNILVTASPDAGIPWWAWGLGLLVVGKALRR